MSKLLLHKFTLLFYVIMIVPALVSLLMPYQGSDGIRILDAPPFFLISLTIILLFSIKTIIHKSLIDFKSPFFWFLIYLNITTIILNPSGIIYSLSWVINYFIFRYYSVNRGVFKLHSNHFLIIVGILLLIGVFKILTGLDTDANPYSLLNRNATSTIIIFFFVYYKTIYKDFKFVDILFILLLILNGSRSSILAVSAFYFLLYIKEFSLSNLIRFSFLFIISIFILSKNKDFVYRINSGVNFFNQLASENVEEVGDFERVFLIRSGLMVFKEPN